MKNLAKFACLAALTIAAFSGCTSSVNTVERKESQATPNYIEDQRVINDETLGRSLKVVSVNEGSSGEFLKIQVTLQHTGRWSKSFNYKFEWVDQDGMVLPATVNNWQKVTFQGKEIRAFSAIAPSKSAVDFRLKLQEN